MIGIVNYWQLWPDFGRSSVGDCRLRSCVEVSLAGKWVYILLFLFDGGDSLVPTVHLYAIPISLSLQPVKKVQH
ncbi:hypothetical protein OUZ56_003089 [Daphnia magna]|uniref:Uncharacterized protein n=1 Tax=Daphnia magna TaxID=35525 RepID=A0ABR0A7Q0_9CRUS|nr:hypothetical protein OUZ56_003089 [Daphnia magna]